MSPEEIITHVRTNQLVESTSVVLYEGDINGHIMKVVMYTELASDDCCGEVYFSVEYRGKQAQYTDLNYAIEKVLKACGS